MAKWLMIAGAVLLVLGLLWSVGEKFGLGKLPGDVVVRRENYSIFFPITTCLILSVVLSLIFWLINRWR